MRSAIMSGLGGVSSGAAAASGSSKTAPAASTVDALSMSHLESLLSRMFGPAHIEFFRLTRSDTYVWALSTTGKPALLEIFVTEYEHWDGDGVRSGPLYDRWTSSTPAVR